MKAQTDFLIRKQNDKTGKPGMVQVAVGKFYGQPHRRPDDQRKERGIIWEDSFVLYILNPEKPDVPLNKNDAFQKVQKRRVQEKR